MAESTQSSGSAREAVRDRLGRCGEGLPQALPKGDPGREAQAGGGPLEGGIVGGRESPASDPGISPGRSPPRFDADQLGDLGREFRERADRISETLDLRRQQIEAAEQSGAASLDALRRAAESLETAL
ncbi:MAG: hypothetical protein AAFX79_13890, partial [Planctomycetota bacterium]